MLFQKMIVQRTIIMLGVALLGQSAEAYSLPQNGLLSIFAPCYKDNTPGATCFNAQEAYESNEKLKAANESYAREQARGPTDAQKRLIGEL